MNDSTSVFLDVKKYSDFYDVPRLMLVADLHFNAWVFFSDFDDLIDDYEKSCSVYPVYAGKMGDNYDLREFFKNYRSMGRACLTIPLAQVKFDEIVRKKLQISSEIYRVLIEISQSRAQEDDG
jgi:hypothetical protein